MALNDCAFSGRLVRDPELRRTGSGVAVTSYTIAVERDIAGQDGKRETDYVDCVAWREKGEFVSKYFAKGQQMALVGALQTRTWEDKNGNKRKSVEVVADEVYFADSKRTSGNNSSRDEALPFDFSGGNAFSEIEDEDDGNLPF